MANLHQHSKFRFTSFLWYSTFKQARKDTNNWILFHNCWKIEADVAELILVVNLSVSLEAYKGNASTSRCGFSSNIYIYSICIFTIGIWESQTRNRFWYKVALYLDWFIIKSRELNLTRHWSLFLCYRFISIAIYICEETNAIYSAEI